MVYKSGRKHLNHPIPWMYCQRRTTMTTHPMPWPWRSTQIQGSLNNNLHLFPDSPIFRRPNFPAQCSRWIRRPLNRDVFSGCHVYSCHIVTLGQFIVLYDIRGTPIIDVQILGSWVDHHLPTRMHSADNPTAIVATSAGRTALWFPRNSSERPRVLGHGQPRLRRMLDYSRTRRVDPTSHL